MDCAVLFQAGSLECGISSPSGETQALSTPIAKETVAGQCDVSQQNDTEALWLLSQLLLYKYFIWSPTQIISQICSESAYFIHIILRIGDTPY